MAQCVEQLEQEWDSSNYVSFLGSNKSLYKPLPDIMCITKNITFSSYAYQGVASRFERRHLLQHKLYFWLDGEQQQQQEQETEMELNSGGGDIHTVFDDNGSCSNVFSSLPHSFLQSKKNLHSSKTCWLLSIRSPEKYIRNVVISRGGGGDDEDKDDSHRIFSIFAETPTEKMKSFHSINVGAKRVLKRQYVHVYDFMLILLI